MTGWRERNRTGGGAGAALDAAWALGAGRVVDVDFFVFFVFVVGRAGRDGRFGDFDMVFSWIGSARRQGARARRIETEAGYGFRG
jgi:hypothetical protein